MKYIVTVTRILLGFFWSIFAVAAPQPTVATTALIGSYSCSGNSAAGDKGFKGSLVISPSASNPKLLQTVFTYSSGTMDVGTLRAAKVANVYIQRWHSVSGHKVSGLSQFTSTPDGGIALQYVLIEHSTGQFTSGSGTCKPVVK